MSFEAFHEQIQAKRSAHDDTQTFGIIKHVLDTYLFDSMHMSTSREDQAPVDRLAAVLEGRWRHRKESHATQDLFADLAITAERLYCKGHPSEVIARELLMRYKAALTQSASPSAPTPVQRSNQALAMPVAASLPEQEEEDVHVYMNATDYLALRNLASHLSIPFPGSETMRSSFLPASWIKRTLSSVDIACIDATHSPITNRQKKRLILLKEEMLG